MNNLILTPEVIIPGAQQHPLYNHSILITGGKIQKISSSLNPGDYPSHKLMPLPNSLVIPGLVNTHSHIAMTVLRGIAEDLPLESWLNDNIFPREKKLTSEIIYWGSMLGCWEMISSGITCFSDMYLFEDAVAQATLKCGLKALLGEGLFDFPSPNYGNLAEGFKYTEYLLEKYANHQLINISVDPHSLYTCNLDTVIKAKNLADKYNAMLSIHISETKNENELISSKYGNTPIQLMYHNQLLDHRLLAAHCVWISNREIELLAETETKVTHCPVSNLKLGSGIAPLSKMLKNQVIVSLGTDGPASNNRLDILQDMKFAAILEKGINLDPQYPNARTIFKIATENGAQCTGFPKSGIIKEGYDADLTVLDISQPNAIPLYDPFNYLIYAASVKDVTHTIVNGNILMDNRKINHLDIDEITSKIKEITKIIS